MVKLIFKDDFYFDFKFGYKSNKFKKTFAVLSRLFKEDSSGQFNIK